MSKIIASSAIDGASTIEDRVSPLRSVDTYGSWLTPRMPASGPAAARSATPLLIKHYQKQKAYRADMLVALSGFGPQSLYALVIMPRRVAQLSG